MSDYDPIGDLRRMAQEEGLLPEEEQIPDLDAQVELQEVDESPDAQLEAKEELLESDNNLERDQELEERARRLGWKPKDEYDDAPDDFVDAQEFLDRTAEFKAREAGKLKHELDDIRNHVNQQSDLIRKLSEAVHKAEERGRQQMLNEIMQDKAQAYRLGDINKAQELEKRQMEMLQQSPILEQQAPQDMSKAIELVAQSEAYQRFVSDAPWMNDSSPQAQGKRATAAAVADAFISEIGPNNFRPEHVPQLIDRVRRETAPQPAQNVNRKRPAATTKKAVGSKGELNQKPLSEQIQDLDPVAKSVIEISFMDINGNVTDEAGLKAYLKELKSN